MQDPFRTLLDATKKYHEDVAPAQTAEEPVAQFRGRQFPFEAQGLSDDALDVHAGHSLYEILQMVQISLLSHFCVKFFGRKYFGS